MSQQKSRVQYLIEQLLAFGLQNKMIDEEDIIYTRNQLLETLQVDEPYEHPIPLASIDVPETATPILEELLDYAADKGIIPENTLTYRDLLDTKIMGFLMPKPSAVIQRFHSLKEQFGIEYAANDFYSLCQKSDYIRVNRIARNQKWTYKSSYGELEITINLTKPEKDPREIAALKSAPQVGYPKCQLCIENVGYPGRINHPARQTLRTIPIKLQGENWYFQFSPYVYYHQHCIVFDERHVPMKITEKTFARLFDFLRLMPHYFIGSNADLPIVGGSILNHDHFQGGYHTFPMEKAPIEYELSCKDFPNIALGVVHWPMSTLRMQCSEPEQLIELSSRLLSLWREYSDPSIDILAYSKGDDGKMIPHNTITPIARRKENGDFEIDLVFRNNRTSKEHPMGIFHPHSEIHHIKKENIGLIEVMGLFILPGRLKEELKAIQALLTGESVLPKDGELYSEEHPLFKHLPWIKELLSIHGSNLSQDQAQRVIRDAVGEKCLQVLHHAGVFKTDPNGRKAFNRFLQLAGIEVR